jgi:predicted O-methyltransferase YrrM
LLIFIYTLYLYGKHSVLSDASLATDLESLSKAFGKYYDQELLKNFNSDNVRDYYTETTDRDYKFLELFIGPGLHSRLEAPYPIGHQGGNTRQPALILSELRSVNAKRVLEVGSGCGHCSLFLAGAASDVSFSGIDLTPRHVAKSTENMKLSGLKNVTFSIADATKLSTCSNFQTESIDLIFGVEALCHIDTVEGMKKFIESAHYLLRRGGRLVIIDGFRSPTFNSCSKNQRTAMELAECGFRIRAMPSKNQWKELGESVGFHVKRNIDLTHEALPFWELGWRVARVALLFPRLVRYIVGIRRETGANLLSVATTGHAMRNSGSAEYGMLILEKQ